MAGWQDDGIASQKKERNLVAVPVTPCTANRPKDPSIWIGKVRSLEDVEKKILLKMGYER